MLMVLNERTWTRRALLQSGVASGAAALGLGACGNEGTKTATLDWLTWSDHYLTAQLREVQQQTGLSARPKLISDNNEVYLKLRTSARQLDVITGDSLWLSKYGEEGLISSFDFDDIAASEQLYSAAKNVDFWQDGSKSWVYPTSWSTVLSFYDPKHVSPAPTSWDVFTDPKYRKRVVMGNQPTDIMAFAGCATGAKEPYGMTTDELSDAKEWLRKVKPNILKLTSQGGEIVQSFVRGEAWLAPIDLGYDVRVKEAGGPSLRSFTPSEGTVGWAGGMSVVRASDQVDAIPRWFDAMEQAEYVAQLFIEYGPPWFNEKAYKLLVNKGKKERADRFLFNKPEQAFEATLKGPSESPQEYVDAFNEVLGG